MPAPYVPLRIFSCYTMLDGSIEPKAIKMDRVLRPYDGVLG